MAIDSRVDAFDCNTVTGEQLVDSIVKNGGVIIRNFVDQETIEKLEQDVRPHIEADKSWDGDLFPKETRRVTGLAAKSPLYIKSLVMHPLWLHVTHHLLTSRYVTWSGPAQAQRESISLPQVSATIVFSVGPGARDQVLHRDDSNSHHVIPEITAEEYKPARDDQMGLFVAGKKSTRQNGATRFVPKSHLQSTSTLPPNEAADPDCVVRAELEPGDAFMMLGSCYHGASANKTENEERLIFAAFSNKGYLRQEENQYLVLSKEQLEAYDEATLKELGYSVSEPYVGWIEYTQPYLYLKDGVKRHDDLSGNIAREEKIYNRIQVPKAGVSEKAPQLVAAPAPTVPA